MAVLQKLSFHKSEAQMKTHLPIQPGVGGSATQDPPSAPWSPYQLRLHPIGLSLGVGRSDHTDGETEIRMNKSAGSF